MGLKKHIMGVHGVCVISAEFFKNLFDVFTIRKGGGVVKNGLFVLNKRLQCKTVHQ